MGRFKKVRRRKNITFFQRKTYKIDGYGTQHYVKVLGYPILLGVNENTFYIKFGDDEKGLIITKKPPFSVRYGYKKSIKIGKYYFIKL